MSDEALLGEGLGSSGYELKRPRRDTWGSLLYGSFVTAAVVGGVLACYRSNWRELYEMLARPDDPSVCPMHGPSQLLLQHLSKPEPQSHLDLAKPAGIWVGIILAASVTLGLGFFSLFYNTPRVATRGSVIVMAALPAVLGIVAFVFFGNAGLGGYLLIQSGVAVFMLIVWWKHLDLCEKLLAISARALNVNRGLVLVAVLAQLLVLVANAAFGVLTLAGVSNGSVKPNGARAENAEGCVNADGDPVLCCSWQVDSYGRSFAAFATIVMLWTTLLVKEIRVFVTSGVVAQWYFSPAGTSTQGSTKRAWGHALGPSFGSLSIGSAILTLVALVRNMIEQARQKAAEEGQAAGIVTSLLACFAEVFFQLVEFLTKFTTIRCAISGEAFLQAGKNAVDLLKRNALNTGAVWFFPQLILSVTAFTLAGALGLAVGLGVRLTWPDHDSVKTAAIALGVISLVLALVVLLFLGNILLDVVDATYFCYAMDLDAQAVTRADIHDVISKVPSPSGAAVEQPGGEVVAARAFSDFRSHFRSQGTRQQGFPVNATCKGPDNFEEIVEANSSSTLAALVGQASRLLQD
ncbi:hypothetical protein WJX74_000937 [Apatococcus lobatus]|uniref:Choline transporter-like protein n=2 Tax=Apatococcus TaxID=904362 RepID=A0AAW1SVB1_9CHLO